VCQVAAARVQDALGLRRRPAGVHDVERVFRVEGLGLVLLGLARYDVVPPDVAGVVPRHLLARAPYDQDLADARALRERLVDSRLERARRTTAVPTVRRDHEVSVAVDDAAPERVGREAPE